MIRKNKNLMITIMGILAPFQMPLSHNFETFEKVGCYSAAVTCSRIKKHQKTKEVVQENFHLIFF
jgi:hypothetical protein